MLTLGFTLPPFPLCSNAPALPQGKTVSCLPGIPNFQVRTGGTYFLHAESTVTPDKNLSSNRVSTVSCRWIRRGRQCLTTFFLFFILDKTAQVIFVWLFLCCQVLLDQRLHVLLVHGSRLVFKELILLTFVRPVFSFNMKSGWFLSPQVTQFRPQQGTVFFCTFPDGCLHLRLIFTPTTVGLFYFKNQCLLQSCEPPVWKYRRTTYW